MESEVKIRRMFFVQKLTIAEIVRQTKVSRNTVRRVIRADKAGMVINVQYSLCPC
jgi:DNA-binding transcriptional regulator LsrR (DeoR family)